MDEQGYSTIAFNAWQKLHYTCVCVCMNLFVLLLIICIMIAPRRPSHGPGPCPPTLYLLMFWNISNTLFLNVPLCSSFSAAPGDDTSSGEKWCL